MDRELEGRIIIITGGCGDIGAATARKLAARGARVIIFDLWAEAEGETRTHAVGGAAYRRVDQGDANAIPTAVAEVAREFGRLDISIGNAAVGSLGRLMDRTAEDWEHSLRVNLIGCAMLAQAAVRQMLEQPPGADGIRGKLLFTSSWVGTYPYPGSIDYCVSKAALDHLVRLVAQEYAGQGILANAVAPGILNAGSSRKALERNPDLMHMMLNSVPRGELGTPEQVADAFAFLCSPGSNYMTGHILFVDGGCSLTKRE